MLKYIEIKKYFNLSPCINYKLVTKTYRSIEMKNRTFLLF